jgi:copper chaperone CopZ
VETSKLKTIQMRITGMTCPACARGLEASFRKMAGVEKATIDYAAGQAVITFDPSKQSADSFSKLVADCGYKVKALNVI